MQEHPPIHWLFKAAQDGDLAALRAIIATQAAPAGAQWPGPAQGGPLAVPRGFTALTVAASRHHLDCVRFLLSKMTPAETDLCNEHGDTAISMAAFKGDAEALKLLLAKANPNGARNGGSPLISAARMGQIDCLRVLLADTRTAADRQDAKGDTALDGALGAGHLDCVGILAPFFPLATLRRQFQKALLTQQWGNLDALSPFVSVEECEKAVEEFEKSPEAGSSLLGHAKRKIEVRDLENAIRGSGAERDKNPVSENVASLSEESAASPRTEKASESAMTRAPRAPRSL